MEAGGSEPQVSTDEALLHCSGCWHLVSLSFGGGEHWIAPLESAPLLPSLPAVTCWWAGLCLSAHVPGASGKRPRTEGRKNSNSDFTLKKKYNSNKKKKKELL